MKEFHNLIYFAQLAYDQESVESEICRVCINLYFFYFFVERNQTNLFHIFV